LVYDGAAALESTASTGYDVVVLDRDLPAVHGDRVCRRLVRGGSRSRILMLTRGRGRRGPGRRAERATQSPERGFRGLFAPRSSLAA
jgi:CheY-like chemotaxis protein